MKTVLVIDDDEDVREIIVYALENNGYDVLTCSNGLEGLEILKNLSPDDYPGLIIVDYLMPEMDGITFINLLRDTYADTLGKIPMAISSAMGAMDPNILALKDVLKIYKPMDLDGFLETVRRYCA